MNSGILDYEIDKLAVNYYYVVEDKLWKGDHVMHDYDQAPAV